MTAAQVLDPGMPERVGRYQLVTRLGAGGMGAVFLAVARGAGGFERLVAIKLCAPNLRAHPEFVTMFLEEARLAAKLRHPNVVPTLDVEDGPHLYLVMDYVEGGSLAALLRAGKERGEPLPIAVVLRVVLDALAGLHAAHELCDAITGERIGIVHRDVSPHNVLVGTDGVARIVDFGIAYAEQRAVVTRTGELKAKPGYFAPEQVTSKTATARTDVFTCGVVLWEALVGQRLFDAIGHVALVHQILSEEVAPPSQRRPDVPASIDAIVRRALARDPDRRWPSADAFARAIEASGERVADRAEVRALVEARLQAPLAAQREALRRSRSAATVTASSAPADQVPTRDLAVTAAAQDETVATTHAGEVALAPVSVATDPPAARAGRRRWPPYALAGVLVLAGAGAVGSWRWIGDGGAGPSRPAAPSAAAAPVIPPAVDAAVDAAIDVAIDAGVDAAPAPDVRPRRERGSSRGTGTGRGTGDGERFPAQI